jgi:ABC-type multidrug transport system ATPase subunit
VRAFVKDRAKRILVPMTAGWLVLAPPTIAAVVWGLMRTFPDGPPPGTDVEAMQPQGFPLIHLWFLYYLTLFYVLMLTLRAGFGSLLDRSGWLRGRIDALVSVGLGSYLAPIALAAPIFAVLYFKADWPVWFGIPTPDTGLLPKIPGAVGFGTAFAFGWVLHRQTSLLSVLEKQWSVNLGLAVGLTTACLAIVGISPNTSAPFVIEGGAGMRALYAACYTASIWYWTFGIVGAAMRFCSGLSPMRRYLADASYWLYLGHLPIVFALQALVVKMPLHWTIKFPAIIAVTLSVLLVSYHYLVRPTFIGAILNGRKYPRDTRAHAPREPDPSATSPQGPGPRGGSLPRPALDHAAQPITAEKALNNAPAPVAVLANVTKRYGKTVALGGVSLAVRPGELLAVLGPNGAGKTTAIALWLGLLEPDDGIVTVMGGSPFDVQSRLGVGLMLQEVNLAPELRACEHVELTASYYRNPLSVEETIALAGIEALATKRYGKLSAGQKRQVQFATAIAGRPQLLFLDEPTVGLDVEARAAMWRNIRRLLADRCSIVLTTHYLEEAEALADRVAVIAKGKLVAEGTVAEMRSLVSRKRISCASAVEVDSIKQWPGVVDATRDDGTVHVTASDAESVVRKLLDADAALKNLEVKQATLAEAFTELTKEAA